MPYMPKFHSVPKIGAKHQRKILRPSPSAIGYDDTWVKLRKIKLHQDPLCAECLRRGKTASANEVDHIVPLRSGGERLDMANLQSLCKSCHSRKTRYERAVNNSAEGVGG